MAVLLMAGSAQATLIDRGNGLVYDDVNNISWTQDGNISGLNTWDDQVAWANNLVLAGFNDFGLASIAELISLYAQLPGAFGTNKAGDTAPFVDVQVDYWSGTETVFNTNLASYINFGNGALNDFLKSDPIYGWAVRPGDSATAVAEPGMAVLLGLGLIGLRVARRWRGR